MDEVDLEVDLAGLELSIPGLKGNVKFVLIGTLQPYADPVFKRLLSV